MALSKKQAEMSMAIRVVAVDVDADLDDTNLDVVVDEVYINGVEVDPDDLDGSLMDDVIDAVKAVYVDTKGITVA